MRFPSRCHPGDGRPAALGPLVVSFLCLFPGALSESRVEGQGGAGAQEAAEAGPSRLYWTDAGSDKIQRALLDGSEVEEVVAGPRQLRGLAVETAAGRLYWADRGAGKIQRADLDGGGEQDLVTGLSHPRSLVVDAEAGWLYWTDSGTDRIQRADLDGSDVEDLVTDGLQTPLGLALDADAGWLYWTDWGTDKIQRARLDGSEVEDLVTGLHTPRGLALDLAGGRIYWTDSGTDKVQRAHLDGSEVEDVVTGLRLPRALALDAEAGQIYWTDAATGQIQCANLDGSDVRDLVTGLRDPRGLALALTGPANRPPVVAPMADRTLAAGDTLTLALTGHDPDGDDLTWEARSADEKVAAATVRGEALRLVARAPGQAEIEVTARDPGGRTGTQRFTLTVPANQPPEAVARLYWTETGRIRRARLDGSGIQDLITGLSQPRALALDAAGGRLYWTDPRADKIQRAALDGSLIEDLVTTGLEAPSGLALDPAAGRLYWTDYGTDRVQRAGLDGSGVEALVTTGLRQPQGLALGAGRLYWTDAGADRIQAADLDGAGVRNLVTTGLQSPQDIALDTLGGYLYWADFGTDKIQRAPLDGSPVQDLVTEGLRAPQGMALDAAAGRIYWTDTGTGKIQRARLDGVGVEDLIAEGLDTPYDLAVGAGLPARRVRVGDEPDTLALAGRFRDPEGGPLSYHAVSADMAVAAAEVAGTRISITAVAAGRTSIAVTARDEQGLQTTLPLAVHVLRRPNRPPTLAPLADLTATAGDTLTLGIPATDPDGDRLRYTASAADSAIARASAVDSVMTLRPKAEGETTIAVTVRDDSLEAAGSFGLTVEWPNRAPVAGDLPDRQVFLGDEARVPLAKVFSDPDGDRLSYTAASKNPAVAEAEAARDTLTITPVAEGQAAIDVTATDPEGLQAAGAFTVTVKPKPPPPPPPPPPGGGGGGGGFIPPPPPPPPPANNQAPTFDDGTSTARTVLESAPARQGIQHPVRATDPEGHPLTYRLAGPDADHFTVDRSRGQLRTRTGVAYDYETTDRYSVTLHAEDPYGGTDAIDVTVHVADVDEPPQAPARPRVEPASSTSLTVTWTEPVNTGPDVDGYDVQYRKSGSFLPWPHTGPGATTTIPDLDLNTRYEVQVRATNDEGTGAWSASGFGSTGANQRPVFDESAPTRSLDENTPPNRNIGTPVRATDPELSPITYRLAGRDADSFTLDPNNGQLRTRPGVTYDFETRSRYSVTVEATDEPGGRTTIGVAIDITDDDNERPEGPDRPSVTASTLTSLTIGWTEPSNTGPPITDYNVQYREGSSGAFTAAAHDGTGRTTTIANLESDTSYEIQVQATSDEGTGLWSPPGSGTTAPTQSLPENMTEENVLAHLQAEGVSTVEAFIEALPRLHKRHFVSVFESASPTADFISGTHPRIVSWGADARFIVTWTTNPANPMSNQVEFLQPVPDQGRWIAGVIDFSGNTPTVSHPQTCQSCHGELNRPLWGAFSIWEGTERPDSGRTSPEANRLAKALADSESPRMTPLELWTYRNVPRRFQFGDSDFQLGDSRVNTATPNWEFGNAIAWRHAEVLFNRLKARADYEQIVAVVMCSEDRRNYLRNYLIDRFSQADFNLRLLSGTRTPVQGENNSISLDIGDYDGGSGSVLQTLRFLIFHDLFQRDAGVAALYRSTSNEDAFKDDTSSRLNLAFPAGTATAEDELRALYTEQHSLQGMASLNFTNSIANSMSRLLRPRYRGGAKGKHASHFASRVCGAMSSSYLPISIPQSPHFRTARVHDSGVYLDWLIFDLEYPPVGYQILRGITTQGAQLHIHVANTGLVREYIDTDVQPGTTYAYRIRAIYPDDVLGDWSRELSVTVPASN